MFEDELASNPADTDEARPMAPPRMLNLLSIFKSRYTPNVEEAEKEGIDPAMGDDEMAVSEGLSRSTYMARFLNPTATKSVTSEGDISSRVMKRVT